MSHRANIVCVIACFLILLALPFHQLIFFVFVMSSGPPKRGRAVETWQTDNGHLKIRITSYEEDDAFLAGTYYGFESAQLDSDSWQEFMVFRYDDSHEIPRDQVRFVTDRVAFAFLGTMFGVTTNGGATWSVTDMTDQFPDRIERHIHHADIGADGLGELYLYGCQQLTTNDYGQRWQITPLRSSSTWLRTNNPRRVNGPCQ